MDKLYKVNYDNLFAKKHVDAVNVTQLFEQFCEKDEFYLSELLTHEENIISGVGDEEWDEYYNDEFYWDGLDIYNVYAIGKDDAKYIARITQDPLIVYDKAHDLYLFLVTFWGISFSNMWAECKLNLKDAKRLNAIPLESDKKAVNA